MNKALIDFITKLTLCGILVLIFVVLFNIIKEPYSLQTNGFENEAEVKAAYQKTQKVGEELDKNFMDTYVDDLKAAKPQTVEVQKHNYYVPLPKEFSIVRYDNGSNTNQSVKKNKH
ncbi:hypothetical protein IKQ26_09700 [bacterium]|nr:hypothetical protein [bacterium]